MSVCKATTASIRLLLTVLLVAAPLNAQRRRPPAAKPSPPAKPAQVAPAQPAKPAQPAVTFDTLLAANTYKLYGEVRGVGQLLRSSGVNDIVDPVLKLAAPPKEFTTLVRWLNAHSDELMTSRLMFAAWPSRPKLPQALFVIEFPSAEEAQKFEPQLKKFLPKLLPTPTPASSPGSSPEKNQASPAKPQETLPPAPPPFVLKQSGALVFISESQFTFAALRPTGSKLLSEDQNFRQVHDRFSSESLFLYFDVASAEKEDQERVQRIMEEEQRILEEQKKRQQSEPSPTPDAEESAASDHFSITTVTKGLPPAELGPPQPAEALMATTSPQPQDEPGPVLMGGASGLDLLTSALFFGRPKWPEAIGVGVTFDADTYVVRALLMNSPEVKGSIIPFAPQLVSGPPIVPEAASVLPGNTELLVTLSLDLPLMYEGALKAATREPTILGTSKEPIRVSQPESPFAVYEKKLGLKIKDDLLPLFGNEVSISVPVKIFGMSGPYSSPSPTPEASGADDSTKAAQPPSTPEPVIAISIKDKEAVRAVIPKIIEAFGFKGAAQLAQSEKRDDTELVTIAESFGYAFIGSFLIVSTDPRAVRHAVDSYLNQQTLAGNASFRNYTRWQPRQVLGHVYASPALMDSYSGLARDPGLIANDTLRDFISRLNPTAEPVTFAISNEGLGPLHELHLPKNLVLLMIAGFAKETTQPPLARNEIMAQSTLRMLVSAEATYQATMGKGNYGTIDQLIEQNLVPKDFLQRWGYKYELTLAGDKFEVTAVPLEYEKTGKMSYFTDETGVLRGGDHGGGSATVADKPIQ